MSVAILGGAFLRVCQDLIRLAAFLELLLRVLVSRIAVGMVLHGELAVGSLQHLLGGRARNAQNFVIISFRHVCCTAHASFCCGLLTTRTRAGRSSRSLKIGR